MVRASLITLTGRIFGDPNHAFAYSPYSRRAVGRDR
jgi:hypothetical protein